MKRQKGKGQGFVVQWVDSAWVVLLLSAIVGACNPVQHSIDAVSGDKPSHERKAQTGISGEIDPVAQSRARAAFGNLPLSFEVNQGQTGEPVKFLSRGSDHTLFLTATEAVLVLRQTERGTQGKDQTIGTTLRMQLVGANPNPALAGLDRLPGKSNYFIGSDPEEWRTNIPTYARVKYQNVYPGIDLVHYGNQRSWEHDFIVAPGADPRSIRISFDGPDEVEIDTQGNLVLETSTGEVRLRKPVIYQEINGRRQSVSGGYSLNPESQAVGFQLAAYDDSKPLVIDPVLELDNSSYLGGMGEDSARGIATDGAGNVYVTGSTSDGATLPGPATQLLPPTGGDDGFVVKLDSSGALAYSVYFGGTGDDSAAGIALAASDTAYVVGYTRSSDFPTTPDAFDLGMDPNKFGGSDLDGFVLALSPSGALQYSTYLGGTGDDLALAVAVPPLLTQANTVYVTGTTYSSDFPAKNAAANAVALTTLAGTRDAFVVKLKISEPFEQMVCPIKGLIYSDCNDLDYAIYLGGQSSEDGLGITVGFNATDPFVTGPTCSIDFHAIFFDDAFFKHPAGGCDAFLVEVGTNSSGEARLEYATYLGGSGWDLGRGISLSPWGVVVTGETVSTDFPVTGTSSSSDFNFQGTYQDAHGGGTYDVFVAALSPGNGPAMNCFIGSGLLLYNCADLTYSTFLGGSGDDYGYAVTADLSGVYVTGQTCMTGFPLVSPLPEGPGNVNNGTECDAFVGKFTFSGTDLVYSSYLGGSETDIGSGIVVNLSGELYVTGTTGSANFPQEGNKLQPDAGVGNDAFVAKITLPCTGGGGPLAYTGDGRIIDTANDCLLTDTVPGGLVPSLGLTQAPGAIAVRPDGAEVYGLEDDKVAEIQNILVFDTATEQVTPLLAGTKDGARPEAVTVSPDGTKLFVVIHEDELPNKSNIYVMDTETHNVTVFYDGEPKDNFDHVAVHPDGTRIYATNFEDHLLHRIDTETSDAVDISTDDATHPRSVLVTPDGRWAYVANTQDDSVSVIGADKTLGDYDMKVKSIPVGGAPSDLAVTPEPVPPYGHLVYVAMGRFGPGPVAVIDTLSQDVIIPAVPGVAGSDVTVSPDGTKVYVASESFVQVVEVVDANGDATNKVVGAIVGAGGSVTAFGPEDKDGDGIIDQVDTDPNFFSNDFNDNEGGSGFIMDRWGWTVTVWDGFEGRLYAGARGSGTQDAHIVACGNDVFLNQTDAIGMLCGSLTLEVFRGPVDVGFGVDTFISIPTGGIGRITEAPAGQFLVENLGSVTLRVIDSAGNEIAPVAPGDSFGDEDISLITVDAGGPYAVDEGESITLTGTVTHAEGGDVSFLTLEWDTDGNGAYESPGASATFVGEFVEADTGFPASFRACNSRSECVTDAVNITVRDTKPVVEAGGPYMVEEGSSIELVGSCVGCTSVSWDLDGDGNFETPGETATFAAPLGSVGELTVTLSGSDRDDTVTDTAAVTILDRPPLEVTIDIRPGNRRNTINLGSRGVTQVGVLSGVYDGMPFDATTVDAATVRFAGAPVLRSFTRDINRDGARDAVFHFSTRSLQLSQTDTQATLIGSTEDGTDFFGTDRIRIVPPDDDDDEGENEDNEDDDDDEEEEEQEEESDDRRERGRRSRDDD